MGPDRLPAKRFKRSGAGKGPRAKFAAAFGHPAIYRRHEATGFFPRSGDKQQLAAVNKISRLRPQGKDGRSPAGGWAWLK